MGIEDGELRARLEQIGLDPDAPGDPAEAWRRLRGRFGRQVTLLERYARELPMLFIVSDVELRPAPPGVEANSEARPRVTIERAGGVKCERCWRYVPAVSNDPRWAGLCSRCQDALSRGDQAA
jgi:isoleucyl-tRNA synthetase